MNILRKYKASIIRKLVPSFIRFALKDARSWLNEKLNLACLWRWTSVWLPQPENSSHSIRFVGRKTRLELATIVLVGENLADYKQGRTNPSDRRAFVTEIPFPGALRVPTYLRTTIPLNRTIEEIMADYDDKLRRSLIKQRTLYRRQQVLDDDGIEYADLKMVRPFAWERHGSTANILPPDVFRRFAKEFGRLDFVMYGDEAVACMLGNEHIVEGKRHWLANRCGYPETVFSDPKRLGETNSINHHLAIEWAIQNGFDYCDLGSCIARPDHGLLQFKRRRGAELNNKGLAGKSFFYVRLPKTGEAQFLWTTPLFAIERGKLTLHLGLPEGSGDDEFLSRYRQMGYGGITKVYLHCARTPDESLLTRLNGIFKRQTDYSIVEIIHST